MNQIQQILYLYDRAMTEDSDAVWKVLDGVDAASAGKQLPGIHSIWQLVQHMAFWEDVGRRRFSGPFDPDLAGNFPPASKLDESSWRETLAEFRSSNADFREELSKLDPARLDELTPGGQCSFLYEAASVIQHHVYHAGQIVLLKKAGLATK